MLGNVVIGALSAKILAMVKCMYGIHNGGFGLSCCPHFSSNGNSAVLVEGRASLLDLTAARPRVAEACRTRDRPAQRAGCYVP